MPSRRSLTATLMLLLCYALSAAPLQMQPPAPATPAPPASPVSGIRSKISAGDLLSAESVLEVHRTSVGEDGPWLVGYSWLARGAQLLGEPAKTRRYAAEVYRICAERMAKIAGAMKDDDLSYALGSVIEVQAERIKAERGGEAAAAYVRGELERWSGTVAFQSRLQKRINLLNLEGAPAPELVVEGSIGGAPSLASLRGKPVLLFLWNKDCGDCRAQAPALAKVRQRHRAGGLELLALTRHAETGPERRTENARIESAWKSAYAEVGAAPLIISEASMIRYGGSSTPTFVFIDRKGTVRRYAPTRLTEAELERTVLELLR